VPRFIYEDDFKVYPEKSNGEMNESINMPNNSNINNNGERINQNDSTNNPNDNTRNN